MFWYIYPYSLFYWKRTFSQPEFSVLRHKVCVSMWKRFRFYDIKFSFLRGNVSVATTQRLRFYDIKFAFLRYKVSISTIKRLRFYDIKFPFYRSNGVCFYVKQKEYLWIYLNYIKHNVFYSNMHISYSILVPKVL